MCISNAVVAVVYPGGQPGAGVPCGPICPNFPTNAYTTETDGAMIWVATLAVSAYELVDGIPNGKNILTNNSYFYLKRDAEII